MHEVFITRGDAMGLSKEDQLKIYDPCNCVLVHHGKCHIQAGSALGKSRCARQIIYWEGVTKVLAYLESLIEIFKNPALPQSEWLYVFLLAREEYFG